MRAGQGRDQPRQRRRGRAAACATALLGTACAIPPAPSELTPAAAIAQRGGPLESFTRRSELVVHYGFPGRWRWELSFRRPDRFRLVLDTTGRSQTFASDGRISRTWHGNALLTEEPSGGSCAATLARWLALASLDALGRPDVHWSRLEGDRSGASLLQAHCEGHSARFLLHFDRDLRLVRFSGPVNLPTLGTGRLAARFHDFRRVGRYTLPHAIDYTLDGERFAEERVLEIVPDDPALVADAFRGPPQR
jgi:hypothetical protein